MADKLSVSLIFQMSRRSLDLPPDFKVRIQLNFEDDSQFASLSKNDLVHFNARAFCPKAFTTPPDAWKKCLITSLTFIGQRVTTKPSE